MELRKKMEMTFKDYLDFNYHFVRKRTIITPVAAVIILTATILIIGIAQLGSDWTLLFNSKLIIYYVILLLIPLASILTIRFAAKKQYESNKLMRSETETIINETGISQSNKFGNTSVEWDDLYKVEETKSAFYIYIAKRQAFVLPKRILENGEDAAVRALITKNMAPNKYRIKNKSKN